jgi:hypothetical protein
VLDLSINLPEIKYPLRKKKRLTPISPIPKIFIEGK